MDILQFIQETYLGLIALCYVIGYAIKKSKAINDNWIPLILLFIGGLFGGLMTLGTDYTMLNGIMQGILCGGAAVAGNQVMKQSTK